MTATPQNCFPLFDTFCIFIHNLCKKLDNFRKNCIFLCNNMQKDNFLKERTSRLKAIKKLIKNNRIKSQEELLGLLTNEGYEVTQATLSRDLKLLKVGKVSDGHAGYVYTLPGEDDRGESEEIFVQDFMRGYVSIEWNDSTVVIKTFSGQANSVANALDSLNLNEILGTVAGDNCIFASLRKNVTGEHFMKALKKHIPNLDD